MFGRKPRDAPPTVDGPRDPDLPMLSVAQSQALTTLAARAFADRGIEVVPDGHGTLIGDHQQQYGLHNLAAMVFDLPWRDWPDAAAQHAAAMLDADGDSAAPQPGQILLKLRAEHDMPAPPDFDASTRFPGLLALPAVDYPSKVQEILASRSLDGLAGLSGWDEVRAQALANLRALPAPERMALDADPERDDAAVHLFVAEDFFGASRLLVLDTVLGASLALERPEHGCLVAVPNRHLLGVHVVAGAGVLAAVGLLAELAEAECGPRPGPITDEVFYLPPEGVAQSIVTRREGRVAINATEGPFAAALGALGLIE